MTRFVGGIFIGTGSILVAHYSGSPLLGLTVALLVLGHAMATEAPK